MLMNKKQRIIASIFLIVGLVMLGVGFYLIAVPAFPTEFTGTTQATITDISTSYSSGISSSGSTRSRKREERHDVTVEYEVEGRSYIRPLGYYFSSMAVGQKVEIQYDTRDPGILSSPGGRLFGTLFCLGLGAMFTVFGIVGQVKPLPVSVSSKWRMRV
jgi:hypothetical protein